MSLPTLDVLQRLVREELRRQMHAELAVVQEQHVGESDNYACTVRLRDHDLVLPRVPIAVGRLGAAAIAPVGALVLVSFVGGDINAPIIIGQLYNDEDRPPAHGDGEAVLQLPHDGGEDEAVRLTVSTADVKALTLRIGSAVTLSLQDDDPVVALDVGGNASITVESDGTVKIESTRGLALKAPEASIETDGNMTLKAGGELKLQGSVINLN